MTHIKKLKLLNGLLKGDTSVLVDPIIDLEAETDQLKERLDNLPIPEDGRDGADGYTPIKGKDYFDGEKGDPGESIVGPKGEDGKNGRDGRDGADGKDGKDGKDGSKGKDGSPDKPVDIKKKLESLKGDDRLDVSAIKGAFASDQLYDEILKIPTDKRQLAFGVIKNGSNGPSSKGTVDQRWHGAGSGGGSSITLETNSVANGEQTLLNLIQGTNMTITDDGLGGITFDATVPADFIESVSDTDTVDLTVTGTDLTADVITQMSITSDASGIKLVNDELAPGSSEYYGTDGTGTKGFFALPTTSPGGSDTEVQFNDGGSFGGDSGFTYNKTANVVTINGAGSGLVGALHVTRGDVVNQYIVMTESASSAGSVYLTFAGSNPGAMAMGALFTAGVPTTYVFTDMGGSPLMSIDEATGNTTVVGSVESEVAFILEETGAGTDTITIQAPASIGGSYTLTLPVDDGNNLDVLQTDGSGGLSWVPMAGGAPGGADTNVQFNDGGVFGGDSGFTYDKITSFATLVGLVTQDIHTENANTNTSITIQTGAAVSGNNQGGDFIFAAGDGFGSGTGGAFGMTAGNGGGTGDGGTFTLQGGPGGATSGNGGSLFLTGGGAQGGNSDGGNVVLTTGVATGSGVEGTIQLADSSLAAASNGYVWTLLDDTTGAGEWAAAGGVPGGADTEVQFNDAGSFGGAAKMFWDKVDGQLNLGVATPTSGINVGLLNLEDTYTNAGATQLVSFGYSKATSNGTYTSAGLNSAMLAHATSGTTNSGAVYGAIIQALRNTNLGGTGDSGTITSLVGQNFNYGHDNAFGDTPQTTNVYGLFFDPKIESGTITNFFDIYIDTPSGGGTATNRHSVYQRDTATQNYFGSKIGVGVTTALHKMHVVENDPAVGVIRGFRTMTNPASAPVTDGGFTHTVTQSSGATIYNAPLQNFVNTFNQSGGGVLVVPVAMHSTEINTSGTTILLGSTFETFIKNSTTVWDVGHMGLHQHRYNGTIAITPGAGVPDSFVVAFAENLPDTGYSITTTGGWVAYTVALVVPPFTVFGTGWINVKTVIDFSTRAVTGFTGYVEYQAIDGGTFQAFSGGTGAGVGVRTRVGSWNNSTTMAAPGVTPGSLAAFYSSDPSARTTFADTDYLSVDWAVRRN